MILAEKIMSLRKRLGWSQEELANQLNVSRQSVSKWESAASIPDISKITQMSSIFGVTTDYLLKDEIDEPEKPVVVTYDTPDETADANSSARKVTLEEASEFMEQTKRIAPATALGVMLCVWSPIVLILLAAISEAKICALSENAAAAIGIAVLLIMVASAVGLFIMKGSRLDKWDYMEKEELDLQYGVEAAVLRKKEAFENSYRMIIAVGVAMILVVVAIYVGLSALFDGESEFVQTAGVSGMLLVIGLSVNLFVKNGKIAASYNKLLQINDYTPEKKAIGQKISWFPKAYWCAATAIYLGISLLSGAWHRTWIVWPVAAVLFAAVHAAIYALAKSKMTK